MKRLTIASVFLLLALAGCRDIYENIDAQIDSETIYSDKFEGIINTYIGFERVEIDLMKQRVPASQIHSGRATKTIVECTDFDTPDHRLVIDSVCSWVNITGLTQAKVYDFTIYSEDDYGNRSLPLTASLQPYTSENLRAIEIPQPSIIEATSAAMVEWMKPMSESTHLFKCYHWTYEYTDKDGVLHTESSEGELPSFIVENVPKGIDLPVKMTLKIIPNRILGNDTYPPIIDTVIFQQDLSLKISQSASPAIFLKSPTPSLVLDANNEVFPVTFSWTKTPEVSEYTLKLSASNAFPDASTVTIPLGDVSEYVMTEDEGMSLVKQIARLGQGNAYWTVTPTVAATVVTTQTRLLTLVRPQPKIVGRWLFDDPSNLGKADIGEDLTDASQAGAPVFTYAAGPAAGDGAVKVMPLNRFLCKHGLPTNPAYGRVSDYTLMFYLMWPWNPSPLVAPNRYKTFYNSVVANNTDATFFINTSSQLGGGPSGSYTLRRTGPNVWHHIAISVAFNQSRKIFVDGELWGEVAPSNTNLMFDADGVLLFGDNSGGAEESEMYVSEITLWDAALSEDEIHRHEGLYPIDKSRWSILDYSAQYNAGTYSVNSLLRPYPSNGVGWETAINAVPKHYAIIDLGGRYNIGRIVSDRGYGEPYLKHYNWYISDSPTPPAESSSTWTLIGSGEHLGTTAAWGTSQALQFPEGVQGRYLKVQLIDGDGRYVVLIYCSVFEKR